MSYKPGKMGVAEGTVLVFFTTFTSVFLSSWSVLTEDTATATWLVPFISAACFIIMFAMLLFVMRRVPGDLYDIAGQLLGNMGARFIAFYFIAIFFTEAILLLRQFGENTLLTALPDMDMCTILGWYALIAASAVYIGIEPLARTCFLSLPFGLIGAVSIVLMLYNKFNLYNLSPWLGNGLPGLFNTGVSASGFYLYTFLLPILAPAFHNLKTIRTAALLGLGLSALLRTATLFTYLGVFSVAVGREKILPIFEIMRLIYINRFVQRVESFFIILWVIFGIATIAIHLYIAMHLLTRLFQLPSMRPLILPLAIIMAQLALLPSDIAATIELTTKVSQTVLNFGAFAIPVILLIATLRKGKGKREGKPCAVK